jgi:hypothetical protein
MSKRTKTEAQRIVDEFNKANPQGPMDFQRVARACQQRIHELAEEAVTNYRLRNRRRDGIKPRRIDPRSATPIGSGVAMVAAGLSVADQVELMVPPAASQEMKFVIFAASPLHGFELPKPLKFPTSCIENTAS